MAKRPGRPDLPCVYGGMKITALVHTEVFTARVTKASGGRTFRFRRITAEGGRGGGADHQFRRRDYLTKWVKGWDGDDADTFRAQQLLLKD